MISEIADILPQAAYLGYEIDQSINLHSSYEPYQTYPTTFCAIGEFLGSQFILAITWHHIFSDAERNLHALPKNSGGLGLQNIVQVENLELINSREVTKTLVENAITQIAN